MKKIIINDYQNYLSSIEKSELLKKFDSNFDLIVDTLDLYYDFPVMTFYLFPSEKVKIQETGEDGYAETDRDTFSVFMVYNDDIKPIGPHEQVHLLTNHLGTPNFVFSDGLAEYFEKYWRNDIDGKPVRLEHKEWVKRFLEDDTYISINEIFDDYKFWELDESAMISYPESGAFIKYLVEKYGIKKVMEAYKQMKRRPTNPRYNFNVFKKTFSKSVLEVEKEWIKQLK